MKIINYGSLNVDFVYQVQSIVAPGETISALNCKRFPGGKGANQSIAICRAGAEIWHAGQVGKDTIWLKELLQEEGVNVKHIGISDTTPGGCAIIQVDASGQNSIIVLGGTNQSIPELQIAQVLKDANPGDWMTLQNEINLTPLAIKAGKEAGLKICFNPSPITDAVLSSYPLECVDLLIVNELEAATLSGLSTSSRPEQLVDELRARFAIPMIVITLGAQGSIFYSRETGFIRQCSYPVTPVDTTGAGDTFTGYLLAGIALGKSISEALDTAARAAAISVTRKGAIPSIPTQTEVAQNAW